MENGTRASAATKSELRAGRIYRRRTNEETNTEEGASGVVRGACVDEGRDNKCGAGMNGARVKEEGVGERRSEREKGRKTTQAESEMERGGRWKEHG